MVNYYKPQSPIQSGEDFIYPITTADQIIKSDKSRRLEQAGLIVADNSTSLGGVAAKDYALKTDTAPDSSKLGGKTLAEIMLTIYPVGSVYISMNSTSPASLFGGEWTQINGRFLSVQARRKTTTTVRLREAITLQRTARAARRRIR